MKFCPGQWFFLHLPQDAGDAATWRAPFSIASAPAEDGMLEFVIKIYKDFTTRASQLAVGDPIGVEGPFGAFAAPPDVKRVLLFAGGIGVTPFLSMIRAWAKVVARPDVMLFYSERSPGPHVCFSELQKIACQWQGFVFVPTYTGESIPEYWNGERGRVCEAMIRKFVPDFQQIFALVCGKKVFAEEIKTQLSNLGVDIKTQMRLESFG